jgi:alpha-2-macroglobulin
MRYLLLLLPLLLAAQTTSAQDLLKGLRHSPYTYIYSLTNQQAARAYADGLSKPDPAYFTSQLDSFPTRKIRPAVLPYAYYIYLYVHASICEQVLALEGVNNVSPQLMSDFNCLQTNPVPKRLATTVYLALPRFLLTGDSALVWGQVTNHAGDTLAVRTRFLEGGRTKGLREATLTSSLKDSLWVSPHTTDSLQLTYELLGEAGRLDGERRKLPVYRKGVREARGEFMVLRPDSAKTLALEASTSPWQLQAFASTQEPLLREVHTILDFPYYCNEQAASKLYALLLLNSARLEADRQPQRQAQIRRLIRQLQENQRTDDGLWGWWPSSSGELWITRHVVGALQLAREQGHAVNFSQKELQSGLRWKLQATRYPYEQLQLLEVLSQLKAAPIPYQELIPQLEDSLQKDELARLRLLRLRAAAGMPFTEADVLALKHETMLGAYYWGPAGGWNPAQTSLVATAWAWGLLRQLGATEAMDRAELYLWNNRPGGQWRNTYESAQALLQLMPLLARQEKQEPALELQAFGQTHIYTELPLRRPVALPGADVALMNIGNTPLYLNAYTERWIETPEAEGTDFTIRTHFSDNRQVLRRGEEVTMIATVEVKKLAEYVMIELPIPAGCTYEDKQRSGLEIHREYFRDRVVIFCRSLPEGTHTFSINLQPQFKGTYTLNPAQVSLMYFPGIFGRTGMQQVEIR